MINNNDNNNNHIEKEKPQEKTDDSKDSNNNHKNNENVKPPVQKPKEEVDEPNDPNHKNTFNKLEKPQINYVKREFGGFLKNLSYYNHTHETRKTIFWCWLQGLENAPKLYLANLNSLYLNCKGFNIVIITEKNMLDYVSFPDYVLDKYHKGMMTPTHFSDMLRLELLIKFGGTWIDASVLITKYEEKFFDKDLFFFQDNIVACAGSSWFITAEKDNPVLKTTRALLYEYWKTANELYNYFLFHLFFKMATERYIEDIKKIPYYSNKPVHYLQAELTKVYSEKRYKDILKNVFVHKLTIKLNNIKNNSFYHHVINEYYDSNILNITLYNDTFIYIK